MQHDRKDCGAACLSMITEYYGKHLPISKSRDLIKVDHNGSNMWGIVNGSSLIGLEATALEGNENDFIEGVANGEIVFPFIARIVNNEMMDHFIVVYSMKKNKILVADPANNKIAYWNISKFFDSWLNSLIVFKITDQFILEKRPKKFISYIDIIRNNNSKFLILIIVSVIVLSINLLGTFLFRYALSDFHITFIYFSNVCIILFACFFIKLVLSIFHGVVISKLSKKIEDRVFFDYFSKLMELPINEYEVRQNGDFVSRFQDISIIRDTITTVSISIVTNTLVALISGGILLSIDIKLFAVLLIVLIIDSVFLLILQPRIKNENYKAMNAYSKVLSEFDECISGISTIKAFLYENSCRNKMDLKYKKYTNMRMSANITLNKLEVFLDFTESVGLVLIFYVGIKDCINGLINLGDLFSFYYIMGFFVSPLKELIKIQPMIQVSKIAMERLDDIFLLNNEETNIKRFNGFENNICVKNVTFSYGFRGDILKNVNIEIKHGEKIIIMGDSGSGKTTLLKLLLKYYKANEGTITIDGEDIQNFSNKSLRENIVYIPQQPYIFEDTVLDNIILGDSNLKAEAVVNCLEEMQLKGLFDNYDLSFEKLLSENGSNISGGQKQLVSISRAIVRKPEVLILDESTNNMDTNLEKIVLDVITQKMESTVIMISHDLRDTKGFDKIYSMKAGRIGSIH